MQCLPVRACLRSVLGLSEAPEQSPVLQNIRRCATGGPHPSTQRVQHNVPDRYFESMSDGVQLDGSRMGNEFYIVNHTVVRLRQPRMGQL